VVKVRSRAQLQLDPVRRLSGGLVRVAGRVSDGQVGIGDATLSISIDGRPVADATTDELGSFARDFPLPDGSYDLEVRFDGDAYIASAGAKLADFDVRKETIELAVRAPAEAIVGGDDLRIAVRAQSTTGPATVDVALFAVALDTGERARIGGVTTGADGLGETSIPPDQLGLPGRKRLEAQFRGNDAYNAAAASRALVVATATDLTFSVVTAAVAFEDDVRGTGVLADVNGTGIPGAAVELLAGGKPVADALTDERGRFEIQVEASDLEPGAVNVQARFRSPDSWLRDSRSAPVAVEIAEPQPVPLRYTLAAFALTLVAVLAFAALRTRPWVPWLEALRRRSPTNEPRRADSEPSATAAEMPASGLVQSRPGIMAALRPARDFAFSGTVADAVRRRPIAGALVAVRDANGTALETTSDARGQFAFADLSAGVHVAEVRHRGFVSERFELTIPHRGDLRGARIDLLPVRERIFDIYRRVAVPLLPEARLWGVWTPRQIFRHVRAQRPASALADLTDFVEDSYFSARLAEESILPETERRADAAQREAAPPAR